MAADGGAPAYDVDHEVFVVLDRFKADQNLVINMIGAWTVHHGWVVGLPSVFTAWSVHLGGTVDSVGNAGEEGAGRSTDHLRLPSHDRRKWYASMHFWPQAACWRITNGDHETVANRRRGSSGMPGHPRAATAPWSLFGARRCVKRGSRAQTTISHCRQAPNRIVSGNAANHPTRVALMTRGSPTRARGKPWVLSGIGRGLGSCLSARIVPKSRGLFGDGVPNARW